MNILNIFKIRQIKTAIFSAVFGILLASCAEPSEVKSVEQPYITSSEPLRIVSANDGRMLNGAWGGQSNAPDSITVIDLTANAPPMTRTSSGTVPNTGAGDPKAAIIENGKYAFIPNHSVGNENDESLNQVSVIDLDSTNIDVIEKVSLPKHPWQALAHPDDKRVIVITDHKFHVFKMDAGRPKLLSESTPFHRFFLSFAINPQGTAIIATAADELSFSTPVELHLFSIDGDNIQHKAQIGIAPEAGKIDQPFAPRFSPDGSQVLILNGLGIAKRPPLDALLSIDMTKNPPLVTESIQNVAQGMESLTFHPSGKFAVITCLDGPYIGHLAVVDLTKPKMRILYYLPIEYAPQGIEFSQDGSMLFVQATTANHINVYSVDGFKLVKNPYVLRTGEGPSLMAISPN